jgi:CheY-like chemotaxis protein
VRQVLSFARGAEGERLEIQPKHLLKELEAIIRDTFPKDVRLHFLVDEPIWTILADPTQIHQVLLNLCVNARDAMPNGGSLSVSIKNCVLDEQYASINMGAKAGRYVKLCVTDTGTGIPPGIRDRIFEPFFTTKELNKGTGLGLSTVLAIVKSHGGFINLYSEVGQGSSFNVYLPASALSAYADEPAPAEAVLPRGKGELVLVVDDEPSILTVTTRTLEKFGYRTMTATDGADAVATYAQNKDKISIVLADMMMPIMDGMAMAVALTRINPNIRIVAASGLSKGDGPLRMLGSSIRGSLVKPFTAETLLTTIRDVLDQA